MRGAILAAAAYLLMGLLTLAHWELVWMRGLPFSDPWSRANVTIVFGPHVALTWPAYWNAMYDLGTWAWWPWARDPRCDGAGRYQAMRDADLSGQGTGHACQ